jgi:hypothetical protein
VREWLGDLGWPAHATRASDLVLSIETIAIDGLPSALAALTPMPVRGRWLALARDGTLLVVDAGDRCAIPCSKIEQTTVDLTGALDLHVAPDGRHAAIVEAYGLRGTVIDIATGRPTMALAREEYHPEVCRFPAAFIQHGGRSLLVHAVAWNRLEVSDPRSGSLLTARDPLIYPSGGPCPPHYLDYFHGALIVSPDGRAVLDDGWVWHPVGVLRVFDVVRWLEENPYESEDGASARTVAVRDTWGRPACWIDERTVAAWGYGLLDDELEDEFVPGVSIYDVTTGTRVRRFLGPSGALAADKHLFAFDPHHGLSAWDVVTGERLLHAPEFCPTGYHHADRCFFAAQGGKLMIGRVT